MGITWRKWERWGGRKKYPYIYKISQICEILLKPLFKKSIWHLDFSMLGFKFNCMASVTSKLKENEYHLIVFFWFICIHVLTNKEIVYWTIEEFRKFIRTLWLWGETMCVRLFLPNKCVFLLFFHQILRRRKNN